MAAAIAMLAMGLAPQRSLAQPLDAALAHAYRSNPQLNADRARLRATDESLAQAQAGYRPTISAGLDYGRTHENRDPVGDNDGANTPHGYSVTMRQPVFRGFRTLNATKRARAQIEATREELRRSEQVVLLTGISTYLDVLRDRNLVAIRKTNVGNLEAELAAVRRRLQVRDAGIADLAQTQAGLATATSELEAARANVAVSEARFEQIFGFPPERLVMPKPPHALLPATLAEARALADRGSPQVAASQHREQAAQYTTRENRGRLLPEVNVEATYQQRRNPLRDTHALEEVTVVGRMTVPIYQAGTVHSQIRQSAESHAGTILDVQNTRRQVRAEVVAAWSRQAASRSQLGADRIGIEASTTALRAVRAERAAGQRTTLDVLNAERSLLAARIRYELTRRDLVFSSYALLAAVGRLTAQALKLPTELYDPGQNLDRIEGKVLGVIDLR